ncbi:hypothetical protein DU508_00105 [Pedobacter chinensis]|uniref:BZIP transcription factor n=1 Tax=Pedobacter chinensis TaxID=2282421 RepID=A0A369Q5T4_9SPHI|nr:hypothetical protein [Pedobacter chinensis]RDC58446.1 hypothetical protein DU508_00105 [Pedobacter chinensis]
MKTIKLLVPQLLLITAVSAQTNTFPSSGNAGIGILAPQANLDFFRIYDANQTKVMKMFYHGSWGYSSYASSFRFLDIESTEGGKILQLSGYGMGIGYDPPAYSSPDKLYINGNVGIGTTAPTEKLAVNGKIRAKEIKVETSNWPDYVFEEGYDVGKLEELESYIKKYKHLPGMPSAKAVESEGVELGEMNKLLVEKIEELTLHIIEIKKENEQVKSRLYLLERKNPEKIKYFKAKTESHKLK